MPPERDIDRMQQKGMTDIKKTYTKGRKKGRMSLKEREALTTALPMIRLSPDTVFDKAEVFGREAPLYLEIGFGDGTFLFKKALNAPQCDFIGIEIYLTGIAKLLIKLISKDKPAALSLTNIRVFNADARDVLTNIPENSLDGIYILFPDPWPKKRHHKRRLINAEFAAILFSKLRTKGFAIAATDSGEYAAEIERSFLSAGFMLDNNELPDVEKTVYALKATEKKTELKCYKFINPKQA